MTLGRPLPRLPHAAGQSTIDPRKSPAILLHLHRRTSNVHVLLRQTPAGGHGRRPSFLLDNRWRKKLARHLLHRFSDRRDDDVMWEIPWGLLVSERPSGGAYRPAESVPEASWNKPRPLRLEQLLLRHRCFQDSIVTKFSEFASVHGRWVRQRRNAESW